MKRKNNPLDFTDISTVGINGLLFDHQPRHDSKLSAVMVHEGTAVNET